VGKAKRVVPKQLPDKLKRIRFNLGLSLEKMVEKLEAELIDLGYPDVKLYSGYITEFEQGKREPILPVLLAYARVAKVNVEILIDNKLEMTFPA
jgi:transcriptional regulator with XRE-family HTH domain